MKTLKTLSTTLQRYANGRNLMVMFFLFFLLATPMRYGPFGEYKMKELNHGEEMLDMRAQGYSVVQANAMFENIGAAGRVSYTMLLGLDVIFAVVYMLFQSLLITYLLQKLGAGNPWMLLNLLPFVRTGLDLLENGLILTMIVNFPVQMPLVAAFSSFATVSKMVVYKLIIAVALLLLVLVMLKLLKNMVTKLFSLQPKYPGKL